MIKKYLLIILVVVFFLLKTPDALAQFVIQGPQGGTNISSTGAGNIGNCLKVLAVSPHLVWTIGSCGTGVGGGSGDSVFSRNNNIGLIYHPTTTDSVLLGAVSTTTTAKLEIIGGLFANASSTINAGLTVLRSTTTSATTTNLAISSLSSELLKVNATGGVLEAIAGTDYEVPLTFGDGLTRTANDVDVDTTQNIAILSNLTSNGFVKTSGGNGTLSVDTNTYLTGNQTITLSGDVSGSGTTVITVTVADDSHAHTGSTISGIDISDDTNLSGDTEIVLTGDALSIASTITRDTELSAYVPTSRELTINGTTYDLSANRSWTVSGGGTGNVATSTAETAGQLPYWTSTNGTPATLGSVATTTVSCSGDASCTPFTVIGSSPITINSTGGAGGSWATTSENYYWSQFRDWSIVNGTLSPTTTLGILVSASSSITRLSSLNSTSTNATTTNLNISGTLDVDGLTSALTLAGATGIIGEYAGASCTNQFPRSQGADGAWTCATVANTDLANSSVSYGGISVALGASDATPAFNLIDATGLPIVAGTTGTLTVARGGTGITTFGGSNTVLYTTSADNLSSEAAFTYNPSTNVLGSDNALFTNGTSTAWFSTNASSTNATSTNLTVSNTFRLSGLNCSGNTNGGALTTDGNGFVTCSDDDGGAGGSTWATTSQNYYNSQFRDWSIIAGSLRPTTTLGILVSASSTIGNGTGQGGLTISGNSTTTGTALFGLGGVGTSTTAFGVGTNRFWNLGGYSTSQVGNGNFYIASSTTAGDFGLSYFTIDRNGNIGLATTTPFTRLSVAGSAYVGGNLTATGTVTFTALSDGCLSTASGVVTSSGVACGSGGGGSSAPPRAQYYVIATSTSMTTDFCLYASTTAVVFLQSRVSSSNITETFSNTSGCAGGSLFYDVVAPETGLIGTTTFDGVYWNGQQNPGSGVVNGLTDRFFFVNTAATSTGSNIITGRLEGTY